MAVLPPALLAADAALAFVVDLPVARALGAAFDAAADAAFFGGVAFFAWAGDLPFFALGAGRAAALAGFAALFAELAPARDFAGAAFFSARCAFPTGAFFAFDCPAAPVLAVRADALAGFLDAVRGDLAAFFAEVGWAAGFFAVLFLAAATLRALAAAFPRLAGAERPLAEPALATRDLDEVTLAGLACFFFCVFAAIDWIQELARDGSRAMKRFISRGEAGASRSARAPQTRAERLGS